MAHILTEAQIAEITGYGRPKEQVKVLRDNGVRHIIGKDGRPALTWEMLNSVGLDNTGTPSQSEDGFNLTAIK